MGSLPLTVGQQSCPATLGCLHQSGPGGPALPVPASLGLAAASEGPACLGGSDCSAGEASPCTRTQGWRPLARPEGGGGHCAPCHPCFSRDAVLPPKKLLSVPVSAWCREGHPSIQHRALWKSCWTSHCTLAPHPCCAVSPRVPLRCHPCCPQPLLPLLMLASLPAWHKACCVLQRIIQKRSRGS